MPLGELGGVFQYGLTLRVQVPNSHILTQNLYYNYYYPSPRYLIIGYMDPLGKGLGFKGLGFGFSFPRILALKGLYTYVENPRNV